MEFIRCKALHACMGFFLVALFVLTPMQGQDRVLVVSGGAIVDVVGGRVLDDADLWVRGSRIERIAPKGQLQIPDGAQVIQAEGKYLIPGLIDMHIHYRNWVPELFVSHGVTSGRDLANQIAWLMAMKRAQEMGLLDRQGVDWYSRSGPRIFVAGVINTYPNGPSHHYQARSIDDAQKAVDWMLAAGVDAGFKLHDGTSLEMMRAVCAKAHARAERVTAHLTKGITVREGVLAGLDGIEHSRWDFSSDTIQLMIQKGVYWTPMILGDWRDVVGISAEDAAHVRNLLGDPSLKYLPETRKSILEVVYPQGGRKLIQGSERAQKFQDLMKLVKAYQESGGKLLAGCSTYFLSGFALHQELAMFVEHAGLTPLQALRTATLNAADYLRLTDLGRLEVGARADIVILDANPLEEIKNTRKISTVILSGKVIPTSYHTNFVQLLPRPLMPNSRVFYGTELLGQAPTP